MMEENLAPDILTEETGDQEAGKPTLSSKSKSTSTNAKDFDKLKEVSSFRLRYYQDLIAAQGKM